jgi:hypothetical protein
MGWFSSDSEHHETPCQHRDDGGPSWIRKDQTGKPNPMGWGSDKPRTVKDTRPTSHGSRAEKKLLSGTGALNRQDASKVPLSGDRPRGNRP